MSAIYDDICHKITEGVFFSFKSLEYYKQHIWPNTTAKKTRKQKRTFTCLCIYFLFHAKYNEEKALNVST